MNTIVVLRHPKVRKSFMQSPSSRPKDCVGPGFCVCFFNTSRAFWFRWIFQTTAQTRFLRVFKTIHKTKNSSSQFFVTPTAHRNNEHSSFCCACNPNVCCFHPHSRGCRSVVSLHAKWYGIPTYVWGREIRNREGNLRIPSSRCFACFAFKYRCSPVLVRHVLGRNLARPSQRPCWKAKALPWLLRLQLGQWNGMPDIYTLTKNFYFVLCNWLTLRFAWFRRFSGLKSVSTTAATTTAAQQLKNKFFLQLTVQVQTLRAFSYSFPIFFLSNCSPHASCTTNCTHPNARHSMNVPPTGVRVNQTTTGELTWSLPCFFSSPPKKSWLFPMISPT